MTQLRQAPEERFGLGANKVKDGCRVYDADVLPAAPMCGMLAGVQCVREKAAALFARMRALAVRGLRRTCGSAARSACVCVHVIKQCRSQQLRCVPVHAWASLVDRSPVYLYCTTPWHGAAGAVLMWRFCFQVPRLQSGYTASINR